MYIVVSVILLFYETLKRRKRILALWNTERISLLVKQLKSSGMNPNISKCREFGESTVLVFDTRSNVTIKYGTHYLIITTVLQMRRLWNLFWWIGLYLPPRQNPAETRSLTQGGIPYLSHIYLGIIVTGLYSCWSVYWDKTCPNQPYLLNKYQINRGFSYFHGI